MASLFDQVTAKNDATTAFRKKWGGVIHPGYTKGGDLSSNDFVGTATQKDVVESLLAGGNSGNLAVWLKENNVNVNDLATTTNASDWMKPIKQTALRTRGSKVPPNHSNSFGAFTGFRGRKKRNKTNK